MSMGVQARCVFEKRQMSASWFGLAETAAVVDLPGRVRWPRAAPFG